LRIVCFEICEECLEVIGCDVEREHDEKESKRDGKKRNAVERLFKVLKEEQRYPRTGDGYWIHNSADKGAALSANLRRDGVVHELRSGIVNRVEDPDIGEAGEEHEEDESSEDE